MKRKLLIMTIVTLTLGVTSCNQGNETDSKEIAKDQNEERFDNGNNDIKKDAEFAVEAANGSMLEVQLGELAQQKASSQAVKDLGRMMVEDHRKANEELKSLAQQKNIALPTSLGEDKQDKYNVLKNMAGEDFDRKYTEFLIDHHEKTIEKFEKQADNGNDPELKQWASGKIPILQNHLQMSEAANEQADNRTSENNNNNNALENNQNNNRQDNTTPNDVNNR